MKTPTATQAKKIKSAAQELAHYTNMSDMDLMEIADFQRTAKKLLEAIGGGFDFDPFKPQTTKTKKTASDDSLKRMQRLCNIYSSTFTID